MQSMGLKGIHVMCMYYLYHSPDGRTATDLCVLCKEDKAGISRILSDLEQKDFLRYDLSCDQKKYRAKAVLTEKGKRCAIHVEELILRAVEAGGEGIKDAERDIFYRVLAVIAENLENVCVGLNSQKKKGLDIG